MTLCQELVNNRLSLSLRDLGIDEKTEYGLKFTQNDKNLFMSLVLYTPTSQSHLGKKFENYSKLNNRTLDRFLNSIFSGLGLNGIYLFRSFTEKENKKKGNKKKDLRKSVLEDNGAMICLRCDNGARDSLFMSIRNSIAHGNIIEKDGYIIFYSISDDKKEYDSTVTFYLRINKISKLNAFFKVLNLYE